MQQITTKICTYFYGLFFDLKQHWSTNIYINWYLPLLTFDWNIGFLLVQKNKTTLKTETNVYEGTFSDTNMDNLICSAKANVEVPNVNHVESSMQMNNNGKVYQVCI